MLDARLRVAATACSSPTCGAGLDATPDTWLGIRDRAIVLLQFAIAGREHEVAHLRLRDVVEAEHGWRPTSVSPRPAPAR
ncbi:hypothetical protein [Streptomyces lydicus]|uniref:hypothetical protein n=1 Tax=Streptomyces lydicus TaxID=47763 RepID=UPI00379A28E3